VGATKDEIKHHLGPGKRAPPLFIFIQATFFFCQFLGRIFNFERGRDLYVPFFGEGNIHEALYAPYVIKSACIYVTVLKGSYVQVRSKGKNELLTPFLL
jgi:hypothetical protein